MIVSSPPLPTDRRSRTATHGHLPVLGASVHAEHLLLVVMLAMLAVVIALVRFYNRDKRCFSRSPEG